MAMVGQARIIKKLHFFHDYARFITCKGPECVTEALLEISRVPFMLVFKCYIHAICDHRFRGGGGQAHKTDHDHSHTHGSWQSTSQSTIPFNMTILDTVPKQTNFKLNFNTFINYIYIHTHMTIIHTHTHISYTHSILIHLLHIY